MLLCTGYQCVACYPPPFRLPLGLKEGFDTKILSHYEAFDISECCPFYGAFDNFLKSFKCLIVGQI